MKGSKISGKEVRLLWHAADPGLKPRAQMEVHVHLKDTFPGEIGNWLISLATIFGLPPTPRPADGLQLIWHPPQHQIYKSHSSPRLVEPLNNFTIIIPNLNPKIDMLFLCWNSQRFRLHTGGFSLKKPTLSKKPPMTPVGQGRLTQPEPPRHGCFLPSMMEGTGIPWREQSNTSCERVQYRFLRK